MPDVVYQRIEGDTELIAAFQQVPALADKLVRQEMRHGLQLLQGDLQPYPSQPSRTRARTFNTWSRGEGQLPRSAFAQTKSGYRAQPKGKRTSKRVYRESEVLGTRWTSRTVRAGGGWRGIYGNTASYAEYVQGEKQPAFHAETGWVTTGQAKKRQGPRIVQLFRDVAAQIVAAVRRIAGG
jgi:hypothetical protein